MREAEIGKRLADKLAKVWTKAGEPIYVLIHIEIQSQYKVNFAKQMFIYNYRLSEIYDCPVASFAILGDSRPGWRPQTFSKELWGCQTTFQFSAVKLLDYKQQWRHLESSDNPFAIVVMAHLKTLETHHDPTQRQQWKLNLVKHLYQKGYQRQAVIDLLRFIDWLVTLPEALEQSFWQDLLTYQKETRMKYVMSIERFAEARGIEQGIEQGIKQGIKQGIERERRALILRQLHRKFGGLPDETRSQIRDLSPSQLEDLGEALLDFAEPVELDDWLSRLQALKADGLQRLVSQFGALDEATSQQIQGRSLRSLSALPVATTDFTTLDDLQNWLTAQIQAEKEAYLDEEM